MWRRVAEGAGELRGGERGLQRRGETGQGDAWCRRAGGKEVTKGTPTRPGVTWGGGKGRAFESSLTQELGSDSKPGTELALKTPEEGAPHVQCTGNPAAALLAPGFSR